MKTIDISSWTLFSERSYSRSYIDASGTRMLKAVDAANKSTVDTLVEEYRIDSIANQLGIPTAQVYDLVMTSNNEIAVECEFIRDKVSCSRAVSREPDKLEEYVSIFAGVAKQLHSIDADTSLVPSFTSKVFSGLDATDIFNEREKDLLKDRLMKMPTDTKCLHGDLNPSNIVHSPSGDYVIDLGLLSYGNPMYDLAFFWYLSIYLPAELSPQLFHFDLATLRKFWELYAMKYMGSNDLREIEEYLKPYARFAGLPVLNIAPDIPSVRAAKEFILSE